MPRPMILGAVAIMRPPEKPARPSRLPGRTPLFETLPNATPALIPNSTLLLSPSWACAKAGVRARSRAVVRIGARLMVFSLGRGFAPDVGNDRLRRSDRRRAGGALRRSGPDLHQPQTLSSP